MSQISEAQKQAGGRPECRAAGHKRKGVVQRTIADNTSRGQQQILGALPRKSRL
jgi:hypothetical protein